MTREELIEAGAGVLPDHIVAQRLGIGRTTLAQRRYRNGIDAVYISVHTLKRRLWCWHWLAEQYEPVTVGDMVAAHEGLTQSQAQRLLRALRSEGTAQRVGEVVASDGARSALWVATNEPEWVQAWGAA